MSADRDDVWLVLPTYNEADERRGDRRRGARAAARRAAGCWSSTTPRPTAPARSPTGSPPSATTSRSCTAPRKQGLGPAYVAGFRRALAGGAELVAQMDADFSHDPADLPRLLDAAADADLVLGSRYVGGRRGRRLGPDSAG